MLYSVFCSVVGPEASTFVSALTKKIVPNEIAKPARMQIPTRINKHDFIDEKLRRSAPWRRAPLL